MHLRIFHHWLMCISDGMHVYLALASAARMWLLLPGVSWCSQQSWHMQINEFIFTGWVIQHLGLLENCWEFCSALEVLRLVFYLEFLEGGSEVYWGTWLHFLRNLDWRFCIDLPKSLPYCCWVAHSSDRIIFDTIACFIGGGGGGRLRDAPILSSLWRVTVTSSLYYLLLSTMGINKEC